MAEGNGSFGKNKLINEGNACLLSGREWRESEKERERERERGREREREREGESRQREREIRERKNWRQTQILCRR